MFTDESSSPVLSPYPSWEANNIHSNESDVIINIYRMRVDACDHLWGVDMGTDDMVGNKKTFRSPRLIVIDLKTDKVRMYIFWA